MPNQYEPGCKGQVLDEDEAIDAEACEFETLKISCKAEQKIKVAIFRPIHFYAIIIIVIIMIIVKVVHAVFGRLTADICPTSDFKKPCTNNNSFPLVSNRLFLENLFESKIVLWR